MKKHIEYKTGYKHQLTQDYGVFLGVDFHIEYSINVGRYVYLYTDGFLKMSAGYAWDGPSPPAIPIKSFMRASGEHDALYQLMRLGLLDQSYREATDRRMYRTCREDRMNLPYAWLSYRFVRLGGGPAADPVNRKLVEIAP